MNENEHPSVKRWRKKTPTLIQMEAVECGAACLGIILGFLGKFVPLEELRIACGVSRDGSNAFNMVRAAKEYGLEAKGFQKELHEIYELDSPAILFWEFNHYVVLEGFGKDKVFLNDPAVGPRSVTYEEFDQGYTGVVLILMPGEEFQPMGRPPSLFKELIDRFKKVHLPLGYLFLAGCCLLIPGLALPALTRVFIDDVLVADILSWKWMIIIGLLIAAVMGGILSWLQQHFLNRLNGRLSIQFSSDFFWHILKLPIAFYTQRYAGEIANRVQLNNQIATMMTTTLITTCIDLLLIIFYGLVMLRYDVAIGSIGFLAAMINIAVFLWIQRSRSDAYARVQQEMGKWIGSSIGALQYIETIKATGIESDFFARFAGYYSKNLNAQQEISKKDTLLGTTAIFLQMVSIAALLCIGSVRVMEGRLTFGRLMALQTLLITFLSPISRFVNFGKTMQSLKINIARLNDVLKNKIDPLYELRLAAPQTSLTRLAGSLEFRNVTFGYSRLDPPLIETLSFTIKPGERLALVGPSGCGKSTIAKLASGLYLPWEGEILYDGKPINEIPSEVFYHSFASVEQDFFLFSGTIRENVTLWNSAVTDEMLIRAAGDACIHDDIMQREKGYEALLIEGGKNFSGGQRQRLEIARALIYSPSLLVLDEATSALDSETEKEISDRIRRKGCSVLMIAHRLSTIQDCDEIIVLDKGKVVQRGSHHDLKMVTGVYMQLVESEGELHG